MNSTPPRRNGVQRSRGDGLATELGYDSTISMIFELVLGGVRSLCEIYQLHRCSKEMSRKRSKMHLVAGQLYPAVNLLDRQGRP